MSDEQRAIIHDLNTASERHGVVLLWVPNTRWTEGDKTSNYDKVILQYLHLKAIYSAQYRTMILAMGLKMLTEAHTVTHACIDKV